MGINFGLLEAEYFGVTPEDDDYVMEVKNSAYTELNEAERRILVLYAEYGTYAAVAKELGCSPGTIKNKIRVIQWKLS